MTSQHVGSTYFEIASPRILVIKKKKKKKKKKISWDMLTSSDRDYKLSGEIAFQISTLFHDIPTCSDQNM